MAVMTVVAGAEAPEASREAGFRGRMGVFDMMARRRHEQIAFWSEPESGYRGIIAVHDTTLGPALGGTRFWNYGSEEEALIDALRLSRGMTYKAAITGLDLGGGKSVIVGDNRSTAREAIFRAHGRAVDALGGRYITAEDVGTSVHDMEFVRSETDHVVGLLGRSGDPSPVTAYGVYVGIKACAKERWGDDSLADRHVAVQGLGNVGFNLCRYLAEEGARLTVADIRANRVSRATAELPRTDSVPPADIYGVDADVFAPCALGAVINDDTLKVLRAGVVAGAANNQLADGRHGEEVHRRGIVYAPDYVINAGGLINVYGEIKGWDRERGKRQAGSIYDSLLRIFHLSQEENVPTNVAADRVALERLGEARAARAAGPRAPGAASSGPGDGARGNGA